MCPKSTDKRKLNQGSSFQPPLSEQEAQGKPSSLSQGHSPQELPALASRPYFPYRLGSDIIWVMSPPNTLGLSLFGWQG